MQLHRLLSLSSLGLLAFTAQLAVADPLIYQVTVNTTSAIGSSADLDIQFNGASLPYQNATATVLNFVTDGTLNPSVSDGYTGTTNNASGMLPGPVTLGNTTTFDDYSENITFGTTITFDLVLDGDAIENPGAAGYSGGTSFVLDFINPSCDPTDPSCNEFFLVNDPNDLDSYNGWIAGELDIDDDGSINTMTNPSPGNGPPAVTFLQIPSLPTTATPEPATWTFLTAGFFALSALAYRRKHRRVA